MHVQLSLCSRAFHTTSSRRRSLLASAALCVRPVAVDRPFTVTHSITPWFPVALAAADKHFSSSQLPIQSSQHVSVPEVAILEVRRLPDSALWWTYRRAPALL